MQKGWNIYLLLTFFHDFSVATLHDAQCLQNQKRVFSSSNQALE